MRRKRTSRGLGIQICIESREDKRDDANKEPEKMETNYGDDREKAPTVDAVDDSIPYDGKGKGEQPEHHAIHSFTHCIALTLYIS